jgi:colicin import membrane protein
MSNAVKAVLGVVAVFIALGAWGGMSQDNATGSSSDGSLGSALHSVTGTTSQDNAVRTANDYLDGPSAFSRKGLIDQLKFEGYSAVDATYAVDNVSVDWDEQAAKSAQSYVDMQGFSRSGLIEQLEFEGFTRTQATYGVNAVGL